MFNREKKMSLLSEMIAFTKTDTEIKHSEYNFLLSVANQLNISKKDFDKLLSNSPSIDVHLKLHVERIIQFHELVLLMSIDQDITFKEIVKLHDFGLYMGLRQESINRVMEMMDCFPNKMVPSDLLIDLFKVQYN